MTVPRLVFDALERDESKEQFAGDARESHAERDDTEPTGQHPSR
jgi:hypothetical protein